MEINNNTELEVKNEELVEEEIHYKELSPARVVMRRFFRSRLSLIGVIMLIALFAFAFIGPPVMNMLGYQWTSPRRKRDTAR